MNKYLLCYLNELVGKFSLNVLLRNIEVKPMPIVKRNFQIRKLKFFAILICKVMYSCEFRSVRVNSHQVYYRAMTIQSGRPIWYLRWYHRTIFVQYPEIHLFQP